jgi:hypothetical protein
MICKHGAVASDSEEASKVGRYISISSLYLILYFSLHKDEYSIWVDRQSMLLSLFFFVSAYITVIQLALVVDFS